MAKVLAKYVDSHGTLWVSTMRHAGVVYDPAGNLVISNGGTVYQGRMPKKLRETIVATTDANTSGANRFIEKFPSTISAANTAPETHSPCSMGKATPKSHTHSSRAKLLLRHSMEWKSRRGWQTR